MATPEDLDAALASFGQERQRLMAELAQAVQDVRHLHETYTARLTDLDTRQAELGRLTAAAQGRLDALTAPPDTPPPPALPAAAQQRLDDLGALLGFPPLTAQEAS